MTAHARDDAGVVAYRLVEAHELPIVDVSKSLKKALLSPAGLHVYKAVYKRIDLVCTILYTAAFPIGASVLTVPAKYARVLAIFKFLFQVPVLVMTSADLRLDLLRCLVTTYEFWFFTIMNTATCIVFSLHLGDMRMFLTPVYWYGIQVNIWADAKVQGPQLASAAALAAVYHVFLLVVFGMRLTPDAQSVELVYHAGRSMTSSDFLMNSFATMMVLMIRTAYRKRALHRRRDGDPRIMRFVSYRCRVKFQWVDAGIPDAPPVDPVQLGPPSRLLVQSDVHDNTSEADPTSLQQHNIRPAMATERYPSVQRLRYVQPPMTFCASNINAPRIASLLVARSSWRMPLLYAVGALGLGMRVGVYACIRLSLLSAALKSDFFVVLSLLSLGCSALFAGAFAACHQRQLVLRLLSSFDFLFLSLQITLCYVSVCVILNWDTRCYAVLTSWVWLHWVLMLDALTPTMKAALWFRSWFAIPVLLLAVVLQVLSSLQILNDASEAVHTRVLWRFSLFRHDIVMLAVPFYLSRGFTIMLWSLRILWRLLRSGSDELTMIQGSVEFYGNPKALRAMAAVSAVSPSADSSRGASKPSLLKRLSSALLGDKTRVHPDQARAR